MSAATESIWHDAECGGYSGDLELWEELAEARGGPVLELGAGTGRVALHLARRGFEVDAVDADRGVCAVLEARAADAGLPVAVRAADVRELRPERTYPLVLAPMQLIQLLGGAESRAQALRGIAAALASGGLAACAIVADAGAVGQAGPGTVPDVREVDGWVYSSLPLGVARENGQLVVRRLRQLVAPDGELTESEHIDVLDLLDSEQLITEGAAAGLAHAGTRSISESEQHVGSTVVLLGRAV